jgi:hypothetical protein
MKTGLTFRQTRCKYEDRQTVAPLVVPRASCPRVSKASRLRIEGRRPSTRAGEDARDT